LLARAWEALAEAEAKGGRPYHTVLRFRASHPESSSDEMARQVGTQLGRTLTAAGVRQTLHRAREKFARLLIEEVARSLETEDTGRVEQELIDLGLHTYCRPALGNRGRPS